MTENTWIQRLEPMTHRLYPCYFFCQFGLNQHYCRKKKGNEMKKLFVICKVRQLYNVLSITNITAETKMIYIYELIAVNIYYL